MSPRATGQTGTHTTSTRPTHRTGLITAAEATSLSGDTITNDVAPAGTIGTDAGAAGLLTPLHHLVAYHRNPRRGNVDAIADSLEVNGQYRPVTVNRGTRTGRPNEVLAGNHTVLAARQLGWDSVAAVFVDVDDDEARRIVLADNRTADLAEYDTGLLGSLLEELDADYEGTGWEPDAAGAILDTAAYETGPATGHLTDPDDVPEPPPAPRTQPGDVWGLGRHRLVCGDSTEPTTLTALMGSDRADMVWTDPPYGVAYVGKTADAMTINNDTLTGDTLTAFLGGLFDAALTACKPGAAFYVAAPPGPQFLSFALALHHRQLWRGTIAWVKDQFVLGHSDYHYKHEAVFYGYVPGAKGRRGRGGAGWYGDHAATTVHEVPRPRANREHPTMKPVDLIAPMLKNSCPRNGLVLDVCAGSGSTLIAAETTGRSARVVELSPVYCDVIARRYQEFTGDLPILERTGQPVDFTAQPLPTITGAD